MANPIGQCELRLCYKSFANAPDPQTAVTTIEESKMRINGSSRRLRFEELASTPDAEWLRNFDRSAHQLYPQPVPSRETLQSIINGKPVSQAGIALSNFLPHPPNLGTSVTKFYLNSRFIKHIRDFCLETSRCTIAGSFKSHRGA
ncbi:unnamed protein product [Taenia asiatica]|uniref:Uncharacterized protein n=1 Tax=Taenia asiatica TaxID=60517 RepID=A0A0R3WES5_TAEAS|nr:unnamed protein product [Taenia asiatica]